MKSIVNYLEKHTNGMAWGISILLAMLLAIAYNCNPSSDSYGYAASMNAGTQLFNPHHLFYNALGYTLHSVTGLDSMVCMLAVNLLAFVGVAMVYYKLLRLWVIAPQALAFMLLAILSFGTLRFAQQNETYIIPLFLSLLGTYFLAKSPQTRSSNLLGFAFLALAILFHQMHVFWYAAFGLVWLVFVPHGRLAVVGGAAIIAIFYLCFAGLQHSSLWHFITHDAQAGLVQTQISKQNFILTAINSVRTWVQVHGDLLVLVNKYPVLVALPIALTIAFIYTVKKPIVVLLPSTVQTPIKYALILAFVLHFCFAFYSVGNAEFMLMLPYLGILICLPILTLRSYKQYILLAFSIGIYNFSFNILPQHYLLNYPAKAIVGYLQQHDIKYFVAHDRTLLRNFTEYSYPQNRSLHFFDLQRDSTQIDSLLQGNIPVYTNIKNFPESTNRAAFTQTKQIPKYRFALQYQIATWRGPVYIHKLLLP